jgi:hypothetical protein
MVFDKCDLIHKSRQNPAHCLPPQLKFVKELKYWQFRRMRAVMMPPFIALPITFVGTCVANVSVAGGAETRKGESVIAILLLSSSELG